MEGLIFAILRYMVNECSCVISKPRRFSSDRQDVIGIKHIEELFSLSMFIEFQEIYIHISKDVNFVSIGINCFDYYHLVGCEIVLNYKWDAYRYNLL